MTYEKGMVHIIDTRDEEQDPPRYEVRLPHSCDAWVIGGVDEIETLIDDLMEARNELYVSASCVRGQGMADVDVCETHKQAWPCNRPTRS